MTIDKPRFTDLQSAGRTLADCLDTYARQPQTVVVGIVRGGVPVAVEVARALSLPLDVILLRKLLMPYGPSDPLIAAWAAGTFVMDERVPAAASAVEGGAAFVADALDAFAARNTLCRGARAPTELRGRTVLLVDNGARTGGTMRAAARALRTLGPARIVAAAPVAGTASHETLHAAGDEVVCPVWIERLGHVGMGYGDYAVPQVEQIHELIAAGTGL